jgi:hypothetical protein
MNIPSDWFYSAFRLSLQLADENDHLLAPKTATGVCVVFPGTRAALITNRHFVDPTWQQPGKYNREKRGLKIVSLRMSGRPTVDSDDLFDIVIRSPSIFYSKTYTNDVALVPLVELEVSLADDRVSAPVTHVMINRTMSSQAVSVANEFGPKVSIGDQVAFPGYSEINDGTYNRPILRMGWIASDPAHNLDLPEVVGDAFLIEGFATQGTSGSPVFATQRGLKVDGVVLINDPSFRDTRMIGITAGYLSSTDHGHSQISYAFKSSVIWECAVEAFGNFE